MYLNRHDSRSTSVFKEQSRSSFRLTYSKQAFLSFSLSWSQKALSSFSETNMKSFCLMSSLMILTSVLALSKTGPFMCVSLWIWTRISLCSFALTMVEILRISFLICRCLDLKRLLSSRRLIIWQVPLLNLTRMIHSFFSSSLQLQYCSLLRFLYLVMSLSFSLILLCTMYPSVKKFWISKAFNFSLFLTIFMGPVYLFLVMSVVGDPFQKMHISGIINLIFLANLSMKQNSQRKGTKNSSFLPLVSSDQWSVNDTFLMTLFSLITIFWQRWQRQPQLLSSWMILWGKWAVEEGQSSFMMFRSCMCLLTNYYIVRKQRQGKQLWGRRSEGWQKRENMVRHDGRQLKTRRQLIICIFRSKSAKKSNYPALPFLPI